MNAIDVSINWKCKMNVFIVLHLRLFQMYQIFIIIKARDSRTMN